MPFVVLFPYLFLVSCATALGTIALFLDEECEQASLINPSVNLSLDTCLVTNGALGIAVQILPACGSGDATLVMYRDTSCATPVNSDIDYKNCFFDGPDSVPAVMFTCSIDPSPATATSTVSAGSSSLAVATNAPASPSDTSPSSTSAQDTPASNKATVTTALPSSASSGPSQTSAASSNGGGSGDSSSGLGHGGTIALSVGIPVATLAVAILAWFCPKPCKKKRHHPSDQYQMFAPSQTSNLSQRFNPSQTFDPPPTYSRSHSFTPSQTFGPPRTFSPPRPWDDLQHSAPGGMHGHENGSGRWNAV